MYRNFIIKFFSASTLIAKVLGYSTFKYPKEEFKISWIGFLSFLINILINLFGIKFAFDSIIFLLNVNLSKQIKITNTLVLSQLITADSVNIIILVTNVILAKDLFKTFKAFEELEIKV